MPIPRVICCVCGQEVNKAQTLHIGDGKRACKSHEGTEEASKRECEKIEQKRQEGSKRPEKPDYHTSEPTTFQPICTICGKVGIRQEEWYTRLMIEMKKYEITHNKTINPLIDDIRKVGGPLVGVSCLFYVMWRGENTKIRVPFRVYEFIKMQLSMGIEEPVLLVCQDCVQKARFITLAQERSEQLIENDMFFRMASLIHAAIDPHITKTAVSEMAESN